MVNNPWPYMYLLTWSKIIVMVITWSMTMFYLSSSAFVFIFVRILHSTQAQSWIILSSSIFQIKHHMYMPWSSLEEPQSWVILAGSGLGWYLVNSLSWFDCDSRGTFWRVVKNRSTEEFEGLPYVCILLSSSLWTYYGFTKPGAILVATVNCVGIVLEFIYVTLFLIYSPPRTRVSVYLSSPPPSLLPSLSIVVIVTLVNVFQVQIAALVAMLDVGFLGGVILVTRLAIHGKLRIDLIGFICAGLSMCMYGSPLAAMVRRNSHVINWEIKILCLTPKYY